MTESLKFRLRKRAEIRRAAINRKSVQEGKPDRIADLLEEAANMVGEWIKADTPPIMEETEFESWTSKPVLGYSKYGDMMVVVYEQFDEDATPCWYTDDSEHWQMTSITHWMPLPEAPQEEE